MCGGPGAVRSGALRRGASLDSLPGRNVLIVEDEYFIATDLAEEVSRAGAEVGGPASTVGEAIALLAGERVDLAILDNNLKGDIDFSIADELTLRGIPFVFATGHDTAMLPERYAEQPRWQKPFEVADLVAALGRGPRSVISG